ncbi:MAG: CBS domain-containing protein [Acidobacteriota bacterium]|nr:CBS domain-containing protein [Acidobacteriota bacterium]MDH3524840.1 CBS domain-containing protein [Acidobacteriota bacterium]
MRCPGCGVDNIPGVDACENCGTDLAGLDLPEARGGFGARLLNDRLSDLELSQPVLATPSTPVAEAISAMRERRCGCALVLDDGELVGIFNERHVLTRVLRRHRDPAATPISEVMSPDPLRLSIDDPPAFAVHCMVAYGFRHLPVLDGDELKGYVSVRNILEYIDKRHAG